MQKYEENLASQLDGGALVPLSGVTVTVTSDATGLPASLYSDDGVTPITAPIVTTDTGYFGFFGPNGEYTITFTSPRIATFTRKLILADPSDNPYATLSQLAATSGSTNIGNGTETVADSLNALQLADYTALRAYAGPRKSVYVTGYLSTAAPSGIAGMFVRDDSDTTTADNGGTVIVATNGKRWKRPFTGYPSVLWFGAKGGDAVADTAGFAAARLATTGAILVPNVGQAYLLTAPQTYGGSTVASGLIGMDNGTDKPIIRFSGISPGSNVMTLQGASMRTVQLVGLIIDANSCGNDNVVLAGSDHPLIDRVVVRNSVRDNFVIAVTAPNYVENGEFDLTIENSGRHPMRWELNGTGDAYINENLFKQLEIRGVSKSTAGANAIRLTSTATGPGSKFSTNFFVKTNFDAQYSTGTKPSLNVVECDSGLVENFMFYAGGWENTGSGDVSGGYAFAVSGSGQWGGLVADALITNSRWGNLGTHASITKVFERNFSFDYSRTSGPAKRPTNPAFYVYQTANASNVTGDGTAYRLGNGGTNAYMNNHGDTISNGAYTAPLDGVYTFSAHAQIGGLLSVHTAAVLNIVIASGSTAGTYPIASVNAYANADGGGNARIAATSEPLHVDAGAQVYATIIVAGSASGTKPVVVYGGLKDQTRFAGRFDG
jgi:hypothetical protein